MSASPRIRAPLINDRGGTSLIALVTAAAVLLPILNLAVDAGSPFHVSTYVLTLDRQVHVLRDAGARRRSHLGLLRHPQPRACRVLFARRLRHGHVPDAPDRSARRLRRSGPAGLHGVPELEGTAVVLARIQSLVVRPRDGGRRAGDPGVRVRLARVSLPRDRRLPVDHHPGPELRAHAGVLSQRHGLRRQQRLHRFQGHSRVRPAQRSHARGARRDHGRQSHRRAISRAG